MRDFIADVAESLRQYCGGHSNTSEVKRLIKLSEFIVQKKLWGRLHAAARTQETRVEYIATSVIAGLFTERGSDSPLPGALEEALKSDDVVLFLRFRNVVVKTASQELFHRWGENDTLSARLWRNLHRVIRHDEHLVVFPAGKPEWVCLKNVSDLQSDLPPVGHDEIVRIINDGGEHHRSLADSITAILSNAVSIPGCQNAVRIEMLFSALRETTSEIMAQQLANEVPCNRIDPLLSVAIDRANEKVFQHMETKLSRYQGTGKLHPDIVDLFRLALSDLVIDCADGGPAQSYYEYLHLHKPNLALEDYRQTLRTRFEYLAESVRKEFIEAMRKQYL